ncbi:MAG: spermidine synthase, partial [Lachnospiraceae bacterium]|nr:spermidine synthase [Lachnospiraceae bacterium]
NINEYLSDTIASVFDYVYTTDCAGSTNRELFASNNPEMMSYYESSTSTESSADLTNMMDRVNRTLIPYEAGDLLLTDDKAPVELLGMEVIDELIQDEVSYYKNIGIKGLLKEFYET